MLLAVAAVPGSVLPQRGVDATRGRRGTSPTTRRCRRGSTGSGCSTSTPRRGSRRSTCCCSSRWSGCIAAAHPGAPGRRCERARRARRARLERMPAHAAAEVEADEADVVLAAARGSCCGAATGRYPRRAFLRRRRVGAERGYLRETGNLVFHLALVGLLVAVAVGSLYGYRGQFDPHDGHGLRQHASRSTTPSTRAPGSTPSDLPPFPLTLDDLTVAFETEAGGNQFAAPRDFSADVTVVDDPGAEPRAATIRVNQPLPVRRRQRLPAGQRLRARRHRARRRRSRWPGPGPVLFLPQDALLHVAPAS